MTGSGKTPYRDGLSAARDAFLRDRARALRRAAKLSAVKRQRLPRRLRVELADHEDRLRDDPNSLDMVQRSARALRDYEGALEVALDHLGEQARHDKRRWRFVLKASGLVAAVGIVGGALAYQPARKYLAMRDACHSACLEQGLCEPRASMLDRGAYGFEDGSWCIATSSADCRASQACSADGRCTALAGRCIAESAESCRASRACSDEGRCIVAAGACVPKDDAACERAPICAREGLCAARMYRCGPSAEGCAQSEVCRLEGRCFEGEHGCVAGR